jgi:hypothetical protein
MFFPNTQRTDYWSSTHHAYQTGLAWIVNFGNGNVSPEDQTFDFYVRAVRGGR